MMMSQRLPTSQGRCANAPRSCRRAAVVKVRAQAAAATATQAPADAKFADYKPTVAAFFPGQVSAGSAAWLSGQKLLATSLAAACWWIHPLPRTGRHTRRALW